MSFNKYLKLTLDKEVDYDNYEYSYEGGICNICGSSCDNVYLTYLFDTKKKTKACYLCHIVTNFKRYHMGKVILAKSNLTQGEINKKTLEYFNENNNIPIPTKIDKSVKIINVQVYQFIKHYDSLDKDKRKIFNNIVVFFTGEVEKNLSRNNRSFFTTDKKKSSDNNNTYDIRYLELSEYKFTNEEKKLLSNPRKFDNVAETTKKMNDKIDNAKIAMEILSTLGIKSKS